LREVVSQPATVMAHKMSHQRDVGIVAQSPCCLHNAERQCLNPAVDSTVAGRA